MKLIVERADLDQVENKIILNEATKEKEYFVSGIFMQAEKVNKNKRFYKRPIMEREVTEYQKAINENRAMGELNHADAIDINYERATHLIKELGLKGNDVYGRAKILDTNIGKGIIKPLLDEGVKLGMSSRALGTMEDSLDGQYKLVNEDFRLLCIDLVSNPSASDAWVSLMENKEWIMKNGLLVEATADEIIGKIHGLPKAQLEQGILNIFQEFLTKMKEGAK